MSNVADSQSESLGEVTGHLADAISRPLGGTPQSRISIDSRLAQSVRQSDPVDVPQTNWDSESEANIGDGAEAVDMDEIAYDRVEDAPRAVLSRSSYNINIETKNYGFVVHIGCQTFAIEKPETVGTIIGKFLANPVEAEKAWYNTSGTNRLEETLQQFQ